MNYITNIKISPEKLKKKEKKASLPNSRIYPSHDLCKNIKSIALQSAIHNETEKNLNLESFIIDNRNSSLERLDSRGPPPEHISFLSQEPLRRGDIIQIKNDNCKYIIFIHWKNTKKNKRVDLDTSFIGYKINYEKSNEICSFNQLIGFKNTVFHSGNIMDAPLPKGGSEYITFHLKELKENNPELYHIMVITQCFNNISFEEMSDAIVGIGYMPNESEEKGNGPNGCIVLSACRLTGKSTTNISAILHLSHDEKILDSFEFVCINAHKFENFCQSVDTCQNMLQNIAIHYDIWRNSLNAPITLLEKEIIKAAAYKEVIYKNIDGSIQIFHKNIDETIIEFYSRLVSNILKN